MVSGDVLTLGGDDVRVLLEGREQEILAVVAAAYKAHGRGDSSLPPASGAGKSPGRRGSAVRLENRQPSP